MKPPPKLIGLPGGKATRREAQEEARRLYVNEGWSYEEAAAVTGIPKSTLEKKGSAESWTEQRETSMSYAAQIRAAKASLMASILTATDNQERAQLVHAWRGMETAWPEYRYNAKADPKQLLELAADVIRAFVEYLAAQDTNALAVLEPHIEPFAAHWEATHAAA